MISKLTSSQEAKIQKYQKKWRKIAISTERINQVSVTKVVSKAYKLIEKEKPAMLFFANPYDALKFIFSQIKSEAGIIKETCLGNPLGSLFLNKTSNLFSTELNSQIQAKVAKRIKEEISIKLNTNPLISLLSTLNWKKQFTPRTEDFFNSLQLDSDLGLLIAIELGIKLEEKLFILPLFNNAKVFFDILRQQQLEWLEPGIQFYIKSVFLGLNYLVIPLGKPYNQIITSIFSQNSKSISQHVFGGMGAIIIASNLGITTTNSFISARWAGYCSYIDFCLEVLNCSGNLKQWEVFKGLVENCGWIFPFEKICIVCDRPTKLSFDSENRLHGEGVPAIEFNNEFKIWIDHGIISIKQ